MLKSLKPRINFKLIGRRRVISLPPLFYLSLVFACGIWASFLFTGSFFSLFMMALAGLCFLIFLSARVWFIPVSIGVFFVLGLLYGSNARFWAPNHIFLSAPEGRISLEGTVRSVPEIVKRGKKETASFVLESKNFYRLGTLYPTRGKVQVFLHNSGTEIHYGDDLRLKGSLETPKKVSNPHVFDYASYLSHQGIFRIFRGIGKFSISRQRIGNKDSFLVKVNQLRTHLQFRISQLYPSPYSELAAALILGFRKNIPNEINEVFIKTGTAHLIAISGLNISLVVTLFYWVVSFLHLPRRINFLMTILFIIIYTALAGANVPVLRAGIMGCMVFIGFLFNQERNLKSAFFFSFFLLLVLDPSILLSASFQLSFLAMGSLLYILPHFEAKYFPQEAHPEDPLLSPSLKIPVRVWLFLRRSLIQSFLASVSATIGMLPVLLGYFNLFSVIGFICNLVAIPLCTLAIALTFILLVIDFMCPPLAMHLAMLPLAILRFELWFIDQLAQIPFSHFYSPSPSAAFFIFYYGLLMIWLAAAKFRIIHRLAIFLMAVGTALFLLSAQIPTSRSVLFDLGKTEAFFISFSNGSKCLINTGRHFPNNQAYWIIRSLLMARAVHRLDSIILTQVDAAHAGGFRTILDYVRANRIFTAPDSEHADRINRFLGFQGKPQTLPEGSRIQFGSDSHIYIQVLTVSKGKITSFSANDRNQKMLYILSADSNTFEALTDLNVFDFNFVYLPHHEDPMSEAEKHFLKQISPQYLAVNQRGRLDEFLSECKKLVHCQILPIQELGALELINSKAGLIYQHSLTS